MVTLEISMIDSKELVHRKRILQSVFGLTKSQVECFEKLRAIGSKGTCVQNLVDTTASERSVEQKKLKKLLNLGLVTRESLSLSEFQDRCRRNNRTDLAPDSKKGYLYIYSAITDEELLEKMQKILYNWLKFMEKDLLRSDIEDISHSNQNA